LLIQNDFQITIEPSGTITATLAQDGISTAVEKGFNSLNLNWVEGTAIFKDLLGYVFKVDANGNTCVEPPTEPVPFPEISFGAKLLRAALKEKSTLGLIGNIPDLFLVSADGQHGNQVKTDWDMLHFYQDNHHHIYRANESVDSHGSMTYSIVSQLHSETQESAIIEYKVLTRYPVVQSTTKADINDKYREFLAKVCQRNLEPSLEELESFSVEDKFEQYTFGASKESTRLDIITKFLEQEKLDITPAINQNNQIERLLKQAKAAKVRSSNMAQPVVKMPPEFVAAKKISKYIRNSVNHLKYFDSPEGLKFLQSQTEVDYNNTVRKNSSNCRTRATNSGYKICPRSDSRANHPSNIY
jgi:hypothetical protein